jgi:peptide/nickel transport system permease protein
MSLVASRKRGLGAFTSGVLRNPLSIAGLSLVGGVALLVILAPLIAPFDPDAVDLQHRLMAPSWQHWMGTDQAGRDVLSRVLWGGRASLQIGILAVAIGAFFGTLLGLCAGFYAGTAIEHLIMRTMDGLFSIPLLVWAVAIIGIVGVGPMTLGPISLPGEAKVTILIGVLYVPAIARVVYSVALVESKADYVRARYLQGANDFQLIVGEILPNCVSPLIVQATLFVAIGIVVEASLSFVGLGVQPPTSSWGTMLADARAYVFSGEWWLPTFPGVFISLTVIGFNLLGDALRDALDPRKQTTGVLI